MREAAEAHRLLFERSNEMVCILDLEGRIISVNPAGERLTGYAAADLVGRLAVDLIEPAYRERAAQQFQERLRGDASPQETVILSRDGGDTPARVTSALISEGGPPVGVLGLITDLSGQVETEQSLRDAEVRFRAAFESAAIGAAIVAPEGRFVEANRALCEIVGYSEAELLGLTSNEITHADDLEADLDLTGRLLASEIETYQIEKRLLHKRGHAVWVLLDVSIVRPSAGKAANLIAHYQDITERRREQEEVIASRARLAEAQHIARLGSWEWDPGSGALVLSAELYDIFGLDPAVELTFTGYLDIIPPEDRPTVESIIMRAARVREPYEMEYRVLRPSGEIRWVHARGEVVNGLDGSLRVRGTSQDITDRKLAEERVREAEARYRTLVEKLPLAMYVRSLDMSRPNIYTSPQFEAMLGYSVEEWQSNPELLSRVVHPDDRERSLAAAASVRETGNPIRDEYRQITREGRVIWVQDETFRVLDDRGEPLIQGFLLDITERKLAEEERDRLREELSRAQRLEAIGRLAGGVAHDFNNMLTAMRGYSELLLGGLQPGTQLHHDAQQIRRAIEKASSLPEQLLAFARKQTLESRLVDLNALVSASSPLLRHMVGETIELVTIPTQNPAFAEVDPDRVEQMLVNLALNARDASPAGGVVTVAVATTETTNDVGATGDGAARPFVVISVGDDGEGMDTETRARAFEPFFTTKALGKGSGLGLASVHGTISQSGGFARIDSEPGNGTTVRLFFPAAAPTVESDPIAPENPAEEAPVVLLAEDEDLVRELVRSVLEREGFEVHASRNGAEALEQLDRVEGAVDLLVTDLVMPRMSGRELADRVVERQPAASVVFISGYSEESPATADGLHVPSPLVHKPFSPGELIRAVNAALPGPARTGRAPGQGTGASLVSCVIADDHPAVLDSASRYLETVGFDVVGRASRGDQALTEIEAMRPAIALVDIRMEPFSGIEIARRAAVTAPETAVVLYTGLSDDALLQDALQAGARGFVLKNSPLSVLAEALAVVAGGGTFIDAKLAGAVATAGTAAPLPSLTKRERQILALVAAGMTNDRVGAELGISAETVQSHVRNAMVKLEADTRTQAVATAIRQALIA